LAWEKSQVEKKTMEFVKGITILTSLHTAMAGCWTTGRFWKETPEGGCTLMFSKPSIHEAQISLIDSQGPAWMQCKTNENINDAPTKNGKEMCELRTDDGCIPAGTDWCTQPFTHTTQFPEIKSGLLFKKLRIKEICWKNQWGFNKCGCHVDVGGDRDDHANEVNPTNQVVVCLDRDKTSNINKNQKYYYMLSEGCDYGNQESCTATLVGKSQDTPKILTLTQELMDEMCGHWKDRDMKPNRSPNFKIADDDEGDRDKIALALANGMFGQYDGEHKNCGAWCLYDVDFAASEKAWLWDEREQHWKRNYKPWTCHAWATRGERNYAIAKSAKLY
jgi:hypothetical protein